MKDFGGGSNDPGGLSRAQNAVAESYFAGLNESAFGTGDTKPEKIRYVM